MFQLILVLCGLAASVSNGFEVFRNSESWADADLYCFAEYGVHLVSIHNEETNNKIGDLLYNTAGETYGWIGYNQLINTWTDNTPNDYNPGFISSIHTECTAILRSPINIPGGDKQWAAVPCDNKYPFICNTRIAGDYDAGRIKFTSNNDIELIWTEGVVRPNGFGEYFDPIDGVEYGTGFMNFPDDRIYDIYYYPNDNAIYWDGQKGETTNIWFKNIIEHNTIHPFPEPTPQPTLVPGPWSGYSVSWEFNGGCQEHFSALIFQDSSGDWEFGECYDKCLEYECESFLFGKPGVSRENWCNLYNVICTDNGDTDWNMFIPDPISNTIDPFAEPTPQPISYDYFDYDEEWDTIDPSPRPTPQPVSGECNYYGWAIANECAQYVSSNDFSMGYYCINNTHVEERYFNGEGCDPVSQTSSYILECDSSYCKCDSLENECSSVEQISVNCFSTEESYEVANVMINKCSGEFETSSSKFICDGDILVLEWYSDSSDCTGDSPQISIYDSECDGSSEIAWSSTCSNDEPWSNYPVSWEFNGGCQEHFSALIFQDPSGDSSFGECYDRCLEYECESFLFGKPGVTRENWCNLYNVVCTDNGDTDWNMFIPDPISNTIDPYPEPTAQPTSTPEIADVFGDCNHYGASIANQCARYVSSDDFSMGYYCINSTHVEERYFNGEGCNPSQQTLSSILECDSLYCNCASLENECLSVDQTETYCSDISPSFEVSNVIIDKCIGDFSTTSYQYICNGNILELRYYNHDSECNGEPLITPYDNECNNFTEVAWSSTCSNDEPWSNYPVSWEFNGGCQEHFSALIFQDASGDSSFGECYDRCLEYECESFLFGKPDVTRENWCNLYNVVCPDNGDADWNMFIPEHPINVNNCAHYNAHPVNTCAYYSESEDITKAYYCIDINNVEERIYTGSDCAENQQIDSNILQCEEPFCNCNVEDTLECSMAVLTSTKCDNPEQGIEGNIFLTDNCFTDFSSTSYQYICGLNNELILEYYTHSTDCSGESLNTPYINNCNNGSEIGYFSLCLDFEQSSSTTSPPFIPSTTEIPIPFEGTLSCGDFISGSTTFEHKVHYYSINIPNDINGNILEYSVLFDSCGSEYDTHLYFYNNDGTSITHCDDCGTCNVQTQLTISSIFSGEYILGIGGYASQTGSYDMQITCTILDEETETEEDDNCLHFGRNPVNQCSSTSSTGSGLSWGYWCINTTTVEYRVFQGENCNLEDEHTIYQYSCGLDNDVTVNDCNCNYIEYDECESVELISESCDDNENDFYSYNSYVIDKCIGTPGFDQSIEYICNSDNELVQKWYFNDHNCAGISNDTIYHNTECVDGYKTESTCMHPLEF